MARLPKWQNFAILNIQTSQMNTRIKEITGIPQQTVNRIIADFTQNGKIAEMGKFRDFEHSNFATL
jgi:hypothetical protein